MSHLQEALTQLRENQVQLDADGCRVGVSREALDIVLSSFTETRILQDVTTHRPAGYILGEVPPKPFIKLTWDVVRDDGAVYQVEERLTFLDSAQGAAAAEMLETMVLDKVERPHSRDPNPDMRPMLPHPSFTMELIELQDPAQMVVADMADLVARRVAAILSEGLGCFWNASIGSVRDSRAETSYAVVGSMAEGMSAIAARLDELSKPSEQEKPHG